MRKIISVFLSLILLVTLCACQSSQPTVSTAIDLRKPIEIPENGIIEQEIITQIKDENAIGSFYGESNGIKYEWTIFGSDIEESAPINLAVNIENNSADGVNLSFEQKDSVGVSALLSVYIDDKWDADSAIAYRDGKAAFSVSLTGTKQTILNIPLTNSFDEYVICPETDPGQESEENLFKAEAESADVKSESKKEATTKKVVTKDNYLSPVSDSGSKAYSDGSMMEKDKYFTDPVPVGKPLPVEPENQTVNKGKTYTCTFSIECSTILNNLSDLDPDKLEIVPTNGVILPKTEVIFYEGESVFDVLKRVCKENDIHMEYSWTPIYNSAYIEGIHNLYEFDCGDLSGWMYRVDGWYPNYGCSRYQLSDGERVEWRYTCDLGNDVGRSGAW